MLVDESRYDMNPASGLTSILDSKRNYEPSITIQSTPSPHCSWGSRKEKGYRGERNRERERESLREPAKERKREGERKRERWCV